MHHDSLQHEWSGRNSRWAVHESGRRALPAQGGPETFFIFDSGAATVTPVPSTVALMATGLVGLVGFVRKRRA